jgi:hypothetical protein
MDLTAMSLKRNTRVYLLNSTYAAEGHGRIRVTVCGMYDLRNKTDKAL